MIKEIKIEFSLSSVKEAIKELKKIQNRIPKVNEEFSKRSMLWIQNDANKNLEMSSSHTGTTDIQEKWVIKRITARKGGIAYEIRNESPFSAIVEFGTGPVGGDNPHRMASVVGYEYGTEAWSFVRDLTSNEWVVKNEKITKEDIKANPSRYLVLNDYEGYEGKSYLYDAFYNYFYGGVWKKIYSEVFDRYMK